MNRSIFSGITIGYDDVGTGRPVVLVHAFPLSRSMWRPQLEALQSGFRLIAPDLRGFGGTGGFEGSPSVEQMADDLAALVQDLKIREPVCLVGLSMGGYVALAFARKYPSLLRALVLADTRAEADTAESKANRDRLIAFIENHPARELIDQMLPKMISKDTQTQLPDVVDEIRTIASAQTAAGITGGLRALRDRPDATPNLGGIAVPTLVIVGNEDVLTPPDAAKTLVAGIRNAQLATVSGAGHLSNMEQPDRFNQALRSFLLGLPLR